MVGRRNHLGAGEKAVPPLQGKEVGFGQHHLCGEKGYFKSIPFVGGRGSLWDYITGVERWG